MCVVEVSWRPPPTQRKPARAGALDEQRQQRRVAAAPDEARAHDHRLEAVAALLEHDLLRERLRARVRRARAERERIASRRRAISGWPCISTASVETCTGRSTPAVRQARRTLRVPSTLTADELRPVPEVLDLGGRRGSDVGALQPAREGRASRGRRARARRRGSRTASAARSERASARTVQPSRTRRSIRRPPTKPEPPVTKAEAMARNTRYRRERRAATPEPARRLSPHRALAVARPGRDRDRRRRSSSAAHGGSRRAGRSRSGSCCPSPPSPSASSPSPSCAGRAGATRSATRRSTSATARSRSPAR